MKVRSNFIPATQGVTERKKKQRPELYRLDQKGNEMFPDQKVVPNKALKVKDIIDRFMRGLPVEEVGAKPVWPKEDLTHESPDMNQLRNMDRMDSKDFARSMKPQFNPKLAPKEPKKSDEKPDEKPKSE